MNNSAYVNNDGGICAALWQKRNSPNGGAFVQKTRPAAVKMQSVTGAYFCAGK